MVQSAEKTAALEDAALFLPYIHSVVKPKNGKKASKTTLRVDMEANWGERLGANFGARLPVALKLLVKDGRLMKKGNKYLKGKKNTQGVKELKPSKVKAKQAKKDKKAALALALSISDNIGEALNSAFVPSAVG